MIDHISIPVSNLQKSITLYEPILSIIGYAKLADKPGTAGFGKKYPEFWLNERPELSKDSISSGHHVCLRVRTKALVDQFHELAVDLSCLSMGSPDLRADYTENYYAAFIQDYDGNRIEVVTYV